MLKLYDAPVSGNCHKVRLFLSILGIDYEKVPVNLPEKEHKSPEHLARHPLGKVPAIDDDGVVIWDSQAILVYLAQKYDASGSWYSTDPVEAANIQSWLAFAAREMWNGAALARAAIKLNREGIDLEAAQAEGIAAMVVLNGWLSQNDWLAADRPTIADLAVYPYAGLAYEGEIELTAYSDLQAWFQRIEALPGYVGMEALPRT